MKTARLTLSFASVVLLGLGFFASIRASLTGEAEAYGRQVDQPAIRYTALVLLVLAIVFACIPDREPQ